MDKRKKMDKRNWYLKMFGFCPYCGRWFRFGVKLRRQNTAYYKEEDNWIAACPDCFDEIEEYWAERWQEYYSSIL